MLLNKIYIKIINFMENRRMKMIQEQMDYIKKVCEQNLYAIDVTATDVSSDTVEDDPELKKEQIFEFANFVVNANKGDTD